MSPPAATLVETVRRHAIERATEVAYSFLQGSAQTASDVTFAELDARADHMAARLTDAGVSRGDRVLLLCSAGAEYMYGLLGCMYAGAIAIPTYPPDARILGRARDRIAAIMRDSDPNAAILTAQQDDVTTRLRDDFELRTIISDGGQGRRVGASRAPTETDGCLLQYTSGSTSQPKGVVITHHNLMANEQQIGAALKTSFADTFVSWLPPFHDMGLIGTILHPLFVGIRSVQIATEAFLRRPLRWLQATSRYRGTILVAPNFSFDLCVRRIATTERARLDLSSVRVCMNGAEPVNPATLDRFATAFGPSGFRRGAFYPCYGLAEATLFVAGPKAQTAPVVRSFDADQLKAGYAVLGETPTKQRQLVACGRPAVGTELRIVDPATAAECGPGEVGEIWLAGPSIASGYWRNPTATAETFGAALRDRALARFMRTGDLGFQHDGELYVIGRIKDIVVVRGRNYHPHDIERCVQALHPALTQDAGAAFGIDGDEGEQLVIVQELDKRLGADAGELLTRIPAAVQANFGIAPAAVVLVKRGTVPKTASGKIMRGTARHDFVRGALTGTAEWHNPARAMHDHGVPRGQGQQRQTRATMLPPPPDVPTTQTTEHPAPAPSSHQSHDAVVSFLLDFLAEKLGMRVDEIDPSKPLAYYGADSLVLSEVLEALERWLGRRLPISATYDNPSVTTVSDAVVEEQARAPNTHAHARRTPTQSVASDVEPESQIAVVGLACRLPGGASSPRALFHLLRNRVEAISEIPAWRWDTDALYDPEPGRLGKMCSRMGGFLPDIDRFDPDFFDISQHEADRMDPQQRLLLELVWEACEEAGINPRSLAGSEAGVFVGASSHDYAILFGGDADLVDADYCSGNSPSVIANRLSYTLDLHGPSIAVDAACASSLVAVQAACTSLERGDCSLAIVAGVNAILAPEASISFSQAGMLSKSGHCRSFDASADGFVRSEGAGVLILRRLADAARAGDRVRALIAGIGVNHSGRSSSLLSPNSQAQKRALLKAITQAGITPADVDYIEAHGVGSRTADAIELSTIAEVMSSRPAGALPCRVGSLKTNLGHLEAASGIAGIIKVVMSLASEEIPPSLHFRDTDPKVQLDPQRVAITTTGAPWARSARPRYAGVSTFGFGGVNAHVVLKEPPQISRPARSDVARAHLALISTRSSGALSDATSNVLRAARDIPLDDVCYTLATRAHLECRRALVVESQQELLDGLMEFDPERKAVFSGKPTPATHRGVSRSWQGDTRKQGPRRLALVFHQAPGASPHLLDELSCAHPVAADAVEDVLRGAARASVPSLDPDEPKRASQASYDRGLREDLALLALHRALAALAREAGLRPRIVAGAGVGGVAAACAAGILTWDAAIPVVVARAKTMASLTPGAFIHMTTRQFMAAAAAAITGAPDVPVLLDDGDTTLEAGQEPSAERLARHWLSPATGALEACLRLALAPRATVAMALGPAVEAEATDTPSLRVVMATSTEQGAWAGFLSALAQLYVLGVDPELSTLMAPWGCERRALPTYPFQRNRCWLSFPDRKLGSVKRTPVTAPITHPMLRAVHTVTRTRSGFVSKAGNDIDDIEDGQAG